MTAISANEKSSPLGDIDTPAPSLRQWFIGGGAAVALHAIAAVPFLPPVIDDASLDAGFEDNATEIGVSLAPVVRPPEPPPEQAPEPEPETPAIEERADNSPPPALPARPRELPDLPDIRPQATPDLWRSGSGASVSLEEYLILRAWLAAARQKVLERLSYPEEARRYGLSGSAVVAIVASRDGKVLSWSFQRRTGEIALDREVERTMRSIKRLPKFPPEVPYETLSFSVPIRFELVFEGRRSAPPNGAGSQAPASGQAPTQRPGLSVTALASCAANADALSTERAEIDALRSQIETERLAIEELLDRYERRREDPPIRVRRRLDAYNELLERYNAQVAAFQVKAGGFSASCGRGTANWENYAQACAPYIDKGNPYCEAFGDLWLRLRANGG